MAKLLKITLTDSADLDGRVIAAIRAGKTPADPSVRQPVVDDRSDDDRETSASLAVVGSHSPPASGSVDLDHSAGANTPSGDPINPAVPMADADLMSVAPLFADPEQTQWPQSPPLGPAVSIGVYYSSTPPNRWLNELTRMD